MIVTFLILTKSRTTNSSLRASLSATVRTRVTFQSFVSKMFLINSNVPKISVEHKITQNRIENFLNIMKL